jgi:hypothetical protein
MVSYEVRLTTFSALRERLRLHGARGAASVRYVGAKEGWDGSCGDLGIHTKMITGGRFAQFQVGVILADTT